MSTMQIKKHLIESLDRADERILRAMYAMLQNYLAAEEEIVAYTVDGNPLTKKDMKSALDDAVSDVEKGNGLSSDDIRNAKKNW